MTLRQLILLRHGETDWNAALRMQGHRDIPLNDTGLAQARAAAPSVAALLPERIVSSDLQRAKQTAAEVATLAELEVNTDKRLRETDLGLWEGLTRDEVIAGWPGEWELWRTSSAHHAPPGGESRWQVAQRSAQVVNELDAEPLERALLVVHGGLIVGLTGLLLELPTDLWGTLIGLTNCHWVDLHRSGTTWRLHGYNVGLDAVVLPNQEDEVAGV